MALEDLQSSLPSCRLSTDVEGIEGRTVSHMLVSDCISSAEKP